MVNTILMSVICAIVLLSVGICIKVAVWKSDRLLQRRINNLRRSHEDGE